MCLVTLANGENIWAEYQEYFAILRRECISFSLVEFVDDMIKNTSSRSAPPRPPYKVPITCLVNLVATIYSSYY